jgi:hypothetical protein
LSASKKRVSRTHPSGAHEEKDGANNGHHPDQEADDREYSEPQGKKDDPHHTKEDARDHADALFGLLLVCHVQILLFLVLQMIFRVDGSMTNVPAHFPQINRFGFHGKWITACISAP